MNETRVQEFGGTIISFTILLSVGYAILRYHIAGDVPWKDFSLFILNKGLCLGAFILLTFNFALGPAKNLGLPVPQSWLGARKAFGMTGFLFILIHALISFMLFSPATFAHFVGWTSALCALASAGSVIASKVDIAYVIAYG